MKEVKKTKCKYKNIEYYIIKMCEGNEFWYQTAPTEKTLEFAKAMGGNFILYNSPPLQRSVFEIEKERLRNSLDLSVIKDINSFNLSMIVGRFKWWLKTAKYFLTLIKYLFIKRN